MQAPELSTTAVPPPPRAYRAPAGPVRRPRSLQFAVFLAAITWYLCARALSATASDILVFRFNLPDYQPLLQSVILLFLIVCGFSLLRSIEQRKAPLLLSLGLPQRSTSRIEWGTGAAIGWGLALATVLPMTIARMLNVEIWTAPRAFFLLALALVTLFIATLAHTLAIFGYGFQRLIEAVGPVRATLLLLALIALHATFIVTPGGTPQGTRLLVALLAGLLLCLCWFRTHGLWLAWGLHFAWAAATAVFFGLPLGGDTSYSSIVDTRTSGPFWLSGGDFGPAAALTAIPLILIAIPILIRVTDDFAWKYTHPPIIPAGYDVTVAPPAAHVAMEQSAQAVSPASLVQILPAGPPSAPRTNPPE